MAMIERLTAMQDPPVGEEWILVESDQHGAHIENCSPRNGFLANQNGRFADLDSAIVEAVKVADLNDVATVFVRDPEREA